MVVVRFDFHLFSPFFSYFTCTVTTGSSSSVVLENMKFWQGYR
jgi:hypothetical protein